MNFAIMQIPSSSDPKFPKGLKSSSPAELSLESGEASFTLFTSFRIKQDKSMSAVLLSLSSESLSDPLLTKQNGSNKQARSISPLYIYLLQVFKNCLKNFKGYCNLCITELNGCSLKPFSGYTSIFYYLGY